MRVFRRALSLLLSNAHLPVRTLGQRGWGRSFCSTLISRRPITGAAAEVRTVDLRTDVVTKPSAAMRRAMLEALDHGHLYKEDPQVQELQKMAADMFGMEASMFVPSGTMSNLIAVMVHCPQRGDEMIVGDLSHLHVYEQGGSSQLAGVHTTTVTTLPDGTFDLDQVESRVRLGYPKPLFCRSRLICLEDTHNVRGGCVLSLNFLKEVRTLADRYGLSVHMDGARVMNAAVAQGVPPSTILQHTDTVSVCLNKGLGAPVGCILAGPRDFISGAKRCLKAVGGVLWQIGPFAAAGKVSLLTMVERMEEDHRHAKIFAHALQDCDPDLFAVDLESVQTNIVRFYLRDDTLSPVEFCGLMAQVYDGEEKVLGQGVKVLMIPHLGNGVRAVWHKDISLEDTRLAIQKFQFVASQLKGADWRRQTSPTM